ncbi:hypothetical protein [Streptomyces sp. enrichment culture]|uniref:hypothetical protein n=1 Tax=Streptomyces sp. enrichment culture TaxID=1795815 RepID=UPI003F56A3E9
MTAARPPAERVLARSYTTGDGGTRFGVDALTVTHPPDGHPVPAYRLTVERPDRPRERWAFTLPLSDRSFTDVLTSPAPDPARLAPLVHLVRALLEEWWDTRAHNQRSARMGQRLDRDGAAGGGPEAP